MIRSEKEYRDARKSLQNSREFLELQRETLNQMSLSPEEIKQAMNPYWCFYLTLEEDLVEYEKIKRGEFPSVNNLNEIGKLLISLRLYKNISQKELAARLGVSEAMVSKDEKNEYHGVTVEKAQKIISVLKSSIVIDIII
ncbi:helix-turn-helix domain-containing protein [Anaeromusa acidaminophila]|uniref:helix-turn-helix domain-containing protein n=1 Tax=Anaeromusa acidaminophila TaxID=81464 RepID=UPI000378135D|nr:helix-turn-helix transcriptional regulator [Anaeromusa acidaminophila]